MPTYKVTVPYVVVNAPTAKAARQYYNYHQLSTFDLYDTHAELSTNDPVDVTVDENGEEIEELELDPWLWLESGAPSITADNCECRLDAAGPDGLGSGAALYMCPRHLAAADLLAAVDNLLTTEDTSGLYCSWCCKELPYSGQHAYECINADCPGVKAKAAIAKATSPQAPWAGWVASSMSQL